MSRYPSESVERMDQQWAETEDERNARLRAKRRERFLRASENLGVLPTELPESSDNGRGEP